ncbi:MAG TPA: glycosyltransferase [Candidatus Saccharimonadales bacterium]|nr:glycosyltransferase [Candidatus Saccharimonadales bacterium]
MRIGFFTDTYLPVSNGICYVIDIIRKDLEAAGHEVFIFAPQNMLKKPPRQKRVIRYSAIQGLLYSDQFFSFFWPPSEVERVRKLKLDLIYIFTPSLIGGLGAHIALKLGIPYVVQYGTDMEAYAEDYKLTTIVGVVGAALFVPHFYRLGWRGGLQFYKNLIKSFGPGFYRSAARAMMSPLHQKAAAIIAISDKTAAQISRWPLKQRIATIPTGVDVIRKNPVATKRFKKAFGIQAKDQVVLYAGRLSVEKNLDKLIDTFELVAKTNPRAKLLLAGDFQYRKHLQNRAASLPCGDRIIFCGQIERRLMGCVYALAEVFVFASTTDCQAIVLNEAAQAGLPLVWCDSANLNPVLKDGVSGLQAENSAPDLAAKITELLKSETLRSTYGRQAKKLARRYGEAAQTKKIEKLLAQVTKRG